MNFIHQIEPWIDDREVDSMTEYLQSGAWLTEFRKTAAFEVIIAEYTGSGYCSVVTNGTASLFISLVVAGVGSGDEVLVPNLTMIATPNAVRMAGGIPVLVDIEPETLCMDLACARKAVTKRTKAVLLVTLNGRAPDMKGYIDFCKECDLVFLEDAAQALGSFQNSRHLGTFGEMGSFSFSSPKIITTGQGGALVTDNDRFHEQIERIKDFGRDSGGADRHDSIGYNFKFTDIQAIIGIEQMKKLPGRVNRKKEIYKLYERELEGIVEFVPISDETTPWFTDVYLDRPDELMVALRQHSIGSRRTYPPINHQAIYTNGSRYLCSEKYSSRGLWLPSSGFLRDDQIIHICDLIKQEV